MGGMALWQKSSTHKTARERTREPLRKTARERTQAPFHPEESPGALCDEEGMLIVKRTLDGEQSGEGKRRNAGGRDGEMKEERIKGNGEKWRKKKQKKRRTARSEEGSWWRWCKEGSKQHTEKDKRG